MAAAIRPASRPSAATVEGFADTLNVPIGLLSQNG